MHLFQVRIAKLVNNETDLEMEQGPDLHCAAVSACGHATLFQEIKSRGPGFLFFCILKKHYFHGINPCHHCKQSRVPVPEMIHHLSMLPCYPEPRSCDFYKSSAEVTVAEGRVTQGG